MQRILVLTGLLCFVSCIPVRIAPQIEDYKLVKARRFKRDLPRDYSFIIEDPKDADDFYNFINMKFDRGYVDVESNVPFQIGTEWFYLSFYEREKITKTLNLIPIAIDLKRQSNDNDPILEDIHVTRNGNWYIIMTVNNDNMEDCLDPDHVSQAKVISFLQALRDEYYTTQNYLEALLRRE